MTEVTRTHHVVLRGVGGMSEVIHLGAKEILLVFFFLDVLAEKEAGKTVTKERRGLPR